MVHAEAEGRTLGALEVRQIGCVRRPGARGTRALSKILVLNGGIVSAHTGELRRVVLRRPVELTWTKQH